MHIINIYLLLGLSASFLGTTNAQTIQKPAIPEKGVGYTIEVKNDTLAFKRYRYFRIHLITTLNNHRI